MRLSFAFYCCLCAALALADDNSDAILHHIRLTVDEAIGHSENYICAQDLSRFYYATENTPLACRQPPAVPAVPLRLSDRLKLDVAVSEGTEIYSWHGAQKFSASTIADVVRDGPISSGSFSGYLRNIFSDPRITFTYKGRSTRDGLNLYDFDYQVPLEASHYELQAGKRFILTPFHGSFSANSSTYQLYSLTLTANGDQISPKSNICAAESRLTYQLVKIADHESLLPASFDLLVGSHTGIFTESKGKYSECHQYSGESTVHFDDDASAPIAAAPELQTEPLRSGLLLQIALRGVLDEDQIYAGLPVEAVLVRDAKIKKGETLTRGATLKGTLTAFRVFHQPSHQVILKIEFNTVVNGAKLYLCHAIHNVEAQYQPPFGGGGRHRGAFPPAAAADQTQADGSLTFNTAHLHLDKSFTSTFITVSQSDVEER